MLLPCKGRGFSSRKIELISNWRPIWGLFRHSYFVVFLVPNKVVQFLFFFLTFCGAGLSIFFFCYKNNLAFIKKVLAIIFVFQCMLYFFKLNKSHR